MKIYAVDGTEYLTGLQFDAEDGTSLLSIEFEQYGGWSDWQQVPSGEAIVGLKCYIEPDEPFIKGIAFLLWIPRP